MAHIVTRVYKNSSADVLRVDAIYLEATRDVIMSGVARRTYARRIEKSLIMESADRVVASIQLVTDADTIVSSDVSGPLNYPSCSWTGTGAYCDMTDLPVIGDTV